MSQDDQKDQSHVTGEVFDAANISQPVPFQSIPRSMTPDNVQLPTSQPSTENNGFTSDNIQQPVPVPEPTQEDSND